MENNMRLAKLAREVEDASIASKIRVLFVFSAYVWLGAHMEELLLLLSSSFQTIACQLITDINFIRTLN
jgi:hypothetical protein